MGRNKNYLVLHIEEWKRLKKQATPPEIQETPAENEYIKSLIEKSQNWIKNWPDTEQGLICQVENQKKKQHSQDITLIKQCKVQQTTERNTNVIQKGRKMIFEESCYGRRLLSAFLESKTLEERDVQIEFQKELSRNAKAREQKDKAHSCSLQNATDMEKQEKELIKCKLDKEKEVAEINKSTHLNENEIKTRNEKKRKQLELEDLRLIKELIKRETLEDTNKKTLFKKDLEELTAAHKEIEQRRVKREYEDERRAEIWRNYVDKINYKREMIHKKRFDAPQFTKHFELINKLEAEKKLQYDEFVNSGVTALANRQYEQEEYDRLKRDNALKTNYSIMQSNKEIAETKRLTESNQNKSSCDKQTIIRKCSCRKTKIPEKDIPTYTKNIPVLKNVRTNLKESTPWNGLSAAHAQFAQEANETLQQCRYKNMARKVVDDYRRLNCLNPDTLPVADYF